MAGWPNGEKPSVETPLAVIVTTDLLGLGDDLGQVERLDGRGAVVCRRADRRLDAPAAPGTSCVTASAVPPAASAALRTAAARTMPIPPLRPRSARVAAGVEPATGADVAGAVGATAVQPLGVGSGVPGSAQVGIAAGAAGVPAATVAGGGVVPGAGGGAVGLTKIGRAASGPLSGRSLEVIWDLAPGMHSRVDCGQSTPRR